MENPPGKKKEKTLTKSSGQDLDLTPHPIISKLLPDPDHPPDSVVLVGYLGPSKKEGCVRFYSDLEFRAYVEIPTSGILHHDTVSPSLESGPTKMILHATTKLELVVILEASFLKGDISACVPFGICMSICRPERATCFICPHEHPQTKT